MMKKWNMILSTVLLGSILLAGPVFADTLLDYGNQTGWLAARYAVDNGSSEFQSFVVTDAEGWNVTSLGLYSGVVQDAGEVGMLVRILADNAGAPDEAAIITEETWTLTGDLYARTWDFQDYFIHLPAGTYWIHCLQGGENYVAVVGSGTSGPTRWYDDLTDDLPPFEVDGSASLALVIEGTIGQPVATEESTWDMVKTLYRN